MGTTLKAYAEKAGMTDSAVMTAIYTQQQSTGNASSGGSWPSYVTPVISYVPR